MQTISRNTKYTQAIVAILQDLSHATNAELLQELRKIFPELSATTVHRASARLCESGSIAEAPADSHGSTRYDANTQPHDHFLCSICGGIRDLDVAEQLLPTITQALGGCQVTGRLVIHGSCERCFIKMKGKIHK